MINYLFRGISLAFGLWVGADAFLPAVDSVQQVESLLNPSNGVYLLRLKGAKATAYEINVEAYKLLEEGDKVLVGKSRAFGQCVYVEKDGLTVYSKKEWRGWEAAFAFVLLAIAFGKLHGSSTDNEDSEGGGWSIFTDD